MSLNARLATAAICPLIVFSPFATAVADRPPEPLLVAPAQVLLPPTAGDPVFDRAPRVRLHPDEQFWPMSPNKFIDVSANHLWWNHSGACDADQIANANPISKPDLAGGALYSHRTESTWPGCNHEGNPWYPNQTVRPREAGGPDDDEGLFMDAYDPWHDGGGFEGTEPVLFREITVPLGIEYWFHYGFSQTLNIGSHEGDWEHIAVKLNMDGSPTAVQYFYHYDSCTLPWADVPKLNGHPIVWVAKEAHGTYPENADTDNGDSISGAGQLWIGSQNLVDLTGKDWYGYGGGWGEVGTFEFTTGPDAPPHKPAPTFSSAPCDMTP